MSNTSHIYLNEITEKKTLHFDSIESIGGSSKDFELKSFDLTLSLQDAGDGYYVTGQLELLRNYPCTVCGTDADLRQDIRFDEFIRVDSNFDTNETVVAKSDESESLVLKTPVWDVLEFIKETINLEEPIQYYGHGTEVFDVCPSFKELVSKGVLIDPDAPKASSAFEGLKNFQVKSQN